MSITLSSHVISRLTSLSANDTGYLIGLRPSIQDEDVTHAHVTEIVKAPLGDESLLTSIRLSLPTGCISIIGCFITTSTTSTTWPLVLQYDTTTQQYQFKHNNNNIQHTFNDEITLSSYIPFRMINQHHTYVYTHEGLKQSLLSWCDDYNNIALYIPSSDQLFPSYCYHDKSCIDPCSSLITESKQNTWQQRISTILVMENMNIDKGETSVLMYTNADGQRTMYAITVDVDILCFAHETDTMDDVMISCITRILAWLTYMSQHVQQDMNDSVLLHDNHELSRLVLKTYHYTPQALSHPITLSYPSYTYHDIQIDDDESISLSQRQLYHNIWMLPIDRPILRKSNAITFNTATSTSSTGRLHNVHINIPSSPVVGGTKYLIQGDYAYYHYMQDKFNDAGWGCAYRTLQTICSWYLLNHYIHGRTIPTHREIQQTLVTHDGKPKNLIGSREWIGAIEVGMVLQHWMGISTRNLFITAGSEIPSHARDLAKHFSTHGTPVMIGGGQLAYGLLGIDWNERTGDCAFLILDPHYTGSEQLSTIVGKGWVGWKKADLFLPNEFYNFCLPQRPHQI